jgi:hypothetical protein
MGTQSESGRPGSGSDFCGCWDNSALSGVCDGDAANDFTLKDGSVVGGAEDPAPFLDSWQVPSSLTSEGQTRFRPDSCATADCSPCLRMVSNHTFSDCHRFVCVNWVQGGRLSGLGRGTEATGRTSLLPWEGLGGAGAWDMGHQRGQHCLMRMPRSPQSPSVSCGSGTPSMCSSPVWH